MEVLLGEGFCAEEARFEDDAFDVEGLQLFLDGFDDACGRGGVSGTLLRVGRHYC